MVLVSENEVGLHNFEFSSSRALSRTKVSHPLQNTADEGTVSPTKPSKMTSNSAGKLWGGRFTSGPDPIMTQYNESIYFDRAFYAQDLRGSIAFARANVATGILKQSEFEEIERGLNLIMTEWKEGTFKIQPGIDEDIHTANERRLGEIIGKEIAGKLHTGRSRNDQVATDMRMWLRDQLVVLEGYLEDFLKVIASRAEKEIEHVMPGYTHLQRAQPIRWSHWMLMYGSYFAADLQRLREVSRALEGISGIRTGYRALQ